MTSSLRVNQDHENQDYSYADPIITYRAQPINQPTTAEWSNLPRTHLVPDQQPSALEPVAYTPDDGATASTSTTTDNKKNFEPDDTPVVYIDLPDQNTPTTDQDGENETWKGASSIGQDRVMTSSLKVNQDHANQDYSYTDPIITYQAQPINQPTAAEWSNLPRTHLVPTQRPSALEPVAYTPDDGATASTSTTTDNKKNFEPDDTPVVYIDLPEQNTSKTVQNEENKTWKGASSIGVDRAVTSATTDNKKNFVPHDTSVVYIDLPDQNTSTTVQNGENETWKGASRIGEDQVMTSSLKVDQDHAYQDYSYTDPIITYRAPPINQPTAAEWSNLPRTHLVPTQRPSALEPVAYTLDDGKTASTSTTTDNKKNLEPDDTPVVYIDLPDQNTSTTVQNGENETWKGASSIGQDRVTASTNVNQRYQGYPYQYSVVTDRHINSEEPYSQRRHVVLDRQTSMRDSIYIDIPDNGTAGTSTASRPDTLKLRKPPPPPPPTTTDNNNKNDQEDNPVVYIVLPEEQGSSSTVQRGNERLRDTTNSSTSGNGADSPHFVEDTIFYDQFKNTRINVGQSNESSHPGSTNFQSGSTLTPSSQFSYETRLGSVYPHSSPAESLPPLIPMTDFPNPPPAYSEIDTTAIGSPTRTEAIVPNNHNAIGLASANRKLVLCPHCNRLVHTLPVRENACITHVIAFVLLVLIFPFGGIFAYGSDYLKYRNHYCPNCFKLIGYEIPMFCQGMTYTKPV